jgi:Tol biopolymer transport system component
VAFESASDNLVAGDTNGEKDIFVHDLLSGETERVSLTSDGKQANVGSVTPAISADGRWVAFLTDASNLVEEDTNKAGDIFVHDRQSGETWRVSVASDGTEGNGRSYEPHISADGRFVVFTSDASNLVSGDTNRVSDVFIHDLQSGETRRVSLASDSRQGNSRSYDPSISADGRFVVFTSAATNLVYGDANLSHDVFVHDLQTGQTRRASLSLDGLQGDNHSIEASISAEGRFVAFASAASNLVYSDTNG